MGYTTHEALVIIVPCYRTKIVRERLRALQMDKTHRPEIRSLLTGPVPGTVNGIDTWFVAPSGSKDGWADVEDHRAFCRAVWSNLAGMLGVRLLRVGWPEDERPQFEHTYNSNDDDGLDDTRADGGLDGKNAGKLRRKKEC